MSLTPITSGVGFSENVHGGKRVVHTICLPFRPASVDQYSLVNANYPPFSIRTKELLRLYRVRGSWLTSTTVPVQLQRTKLRTVLF